MNTTPTIDELLAGIIDGLDDDILPALGNAKAQATATMMKSVLQGVRQLLPVYDGFLVDEHNDMIVTLREIAAHVESVDGEAAARIRERGATLGQRQALPAPPDRAEIMAAHRELGFALEATLVDLDELQRAGEERADAALTVLRGHFGPRFLRDMATFCVDEGLVGRG